LLTSAVVERTLVDVDAIQSGAADQFEFQTGRDDVVLYLELDVLGFNGHREVEHGQAGLEHAEFHGRAVRIRVVPEHVRQVVGILNPYGGRERHLVGAPHHALRSEASDDHRRLQVDQNPIVAGLGVRAAPSAHRVQPYHLNASEQFKLNTRPTKSRNGYQPRTHLFGERRFGSGHGDGIVRDPSAYQTQVADRPAFHGGREPGLAATVEAAQTVRAFGGRQIALTGGALVHV